MNLNYFINLYLYFDCKYKHLKTDLINSWYYPKECYLILDLFGTKCPFMALNPKFDYFVVFNVFDF